MYLFTCKENLGALCGGTFCTPSGPALIVTISGSNLSLCLNFFWSIKFVYEQAGCNLPKPTYKEMSLPKSSAILF